MSEIKLPLIYQQWGGKKATAEDIFASEVNESGINFYQLEKCSIDIIARSRDNCSNEEGSKSAKVLILRPLSLSILVFITKSLVRSEQHGPKVTILASNPSCPGFNS